MFGWNFLLSSCSLVRLYVNLQVKVTKKKKEIFNANWKVKVKIVAGNKKMIAGVEPEPNHVWAPCCETWLKFESKFASVEKKNEIKDFYLLGSNPLVGRHVVNETKIT